MRATVVGANVPAKTLRAACVKADVPAKDVRTVGPRAWVEVPQDTRDAMLARLAEALATGLMVIDVEVGGDGALSASRSTYRGVEEDVTEEARSLAQSNDAPGSVLRPGAMSLWPAMRSRLNEGYAASSALISAASDSY